MNTYDLASDSGLRTAAETVGGYAAWDGTAQKWIRELGETIRWVRSSDEVQRGAREFQKQVWDDNHVAAIGQGNISIDRALDDADFRQRFAARSMAPLPASTEERIRFLSALYEDLTKQLAPFVRSLPRPRCSVSGRDDNGR
jgi:hypothetical protein